jgi:hypothetical protein
LYYNFIIFIIVNIVSITIHQFEWILPQNHQLQIQKRDKLDMGAAAGTQQDWIQTSGSADPHA